MRLRRSLEVAGENVVMGEVTRLDRHCLEPRSREPRSREQLSGAPPCELEGGPWGALVAARRSPGEVFSRAHRFLTGGDARLEILAAEVDRWGVTRFEARAIRPARAGDSVRKLAPYADPQSWRTTQPSTFAQSYHTRVPSPADPFTDPPAAPQRLGASWSGQLFEHARFQLLPGVEATAFRNTLDIDFAVNEHERRISLEYSLHEALSHRLLGGPPRPGGLDVDSGRGRICLGPKEAVFMAGKDIRISRATPLHEELNLLALPFVATWLSLWLMAAACSRELTE